MWGVVVLALEPAGPPPQGVGSGRGASVSLSASELASSVSRREATPAILHNKSNQKNLKKE